MLATTETVPVVILCVTKKYKATILYARNTDITTSSVAEISVGGGDPHLHGGFAFPPFTEALPSRHWTSYLKTAI